MLKNVAWPGVDHSTLTSLSGSADDWANVEVRWSGGQQEDYRPVTSTSTTTSTSSTFSTVSTGTSSSSSSTTTVTMPGAFYHLTSGADDGYWYASTFRNTWMECQVGTYYGQEVSTFMRFDGIPIPQGATINSAKLYMVGYGNQNTQMPVTSKWYANASDDAVAPTSVSEANALALTTAFESWTIPTWEIEEHVESIELKSVIQEVVNRGGWLSGNALMLVVKDGGGSGYTTLRKWFGYRGIEETPDKDVMLWIDFE